MSRDRSRGRQKGTRDSDLSDTALPEQLAEPAERLLDVMKPHLSSFEHAPIGGLVRACERKYAGEAAAPRCPVTGATSTHPVAVALPEVRALTTLFIERLFPDFEKWESVAAGRPGQIALLESPWDPASTTPKTIADANHYWCREGSLFWAVKSLSDAMDSTMSAFFQWRSPFRPEGIATLAPGERALADDFLALPKHEFRRDVSSNEPFRISSDLGAGMATATGTMARFTALVIEVHKRDVGRVPTPEEFKEIYLNSQQFIRDLATLPLILFLKAEDLLSHPHTPYPGFSTFNPAHFTLGKNNDGLMVGLKAGTIATFDAELKAEVDAAKKDMGQLRMTSCPAMFAKTAGGEPVMTHMARWTAEIAARTIVPNMDRLATGMPQGR